MNIKKIEEVKDTALKLDEIRTNCPEDYFYLKGWIHCLLQKKEAAHTGNNAGNKVTNNK